jgi:hypothetical protein
VLGLPFFVTWNLIAHINEQRGLSAKVRTGLAALLFAIVATALWVAPALAAAWIVLLFARA